MDRTRAFAVDTAAHAQLEVDAADEFTWDEATIVQIDHPPHEHAFDIDRFYKIPVTAARSVEQTYRTVDGEVTMVKPPEELRQAAWSLDNAPITLGHPPSRIVDGVDKIHGFTRHPEWDADSDALRAYAYIPVNDTEAKAFIEGDGDDVSIGFWYNAETDDVPSHVDGYQRDLLVDHLALVEEGRCSREDGCGLAADSVDAIRGFHTDMGDGGCSDGPCSCGLHVDADDPEYPQHHYESEAEAREAAERMGCDGVHKHEERGTWMPCDSHEAFEETAAEMEMDTDAYNVGDWVRWNYGDGSAVGRVDTVETDGELSVDGGSRNGTEDNPAYRLEHWDDGEFGNNVVKRHSELESASEPADYGTDAFGTDEDDIDLTPPEAAQNAAQQALDARADDDTTVNGMTDRGWSRAEQLADGGELQPSDIVGGTDGMANWWSRHAPEIVEGGDSLSLVGTDEDNPWSVNGYTSGKGWGGIAGYRWAIRKGNEIKRARDEDADYSLIGKDSMFTEIEIDESKTVAGVTFSGTSDGKLDETAIPSDGFESHYLYPGDTKSDSSYPVVDAEGNLRRGNVEAAWSLGARGGIDPEEHERNLRRLNDEFDSPPIDDESFEEDMTDNPDDNGGDGDGGPISVADLTVDAIAEQNEEVAELTEEVDELEAQLDAATEELDNLKEELASYREDEKQDVVDEITALTDTWDEEELMDLGLDTLEDRLDLAKDIAADVSGGVETDSGDGGSVRNEEFGVDGREPTTSYTGGQVYDLSDTA